MAPKEEHFEKYAPRFFSLFLIVAVFSISLIMKHELTSGFEATQYLETQGYSSVRILQQAAKYHGCHPSDPYRFLFNATSPQGTGSEGVVCFDGESWYEE